MSHEPAQLPPLRFVSEDPAVHEVLRVVDLVADSNATVLISGETGTGKEFIARRIHELSSRARAPFVALNCGAISESIQESEFFGHVRGAFTGADRHKVGYFEAADHGTLFLDELGEMSLSLQVRLLRVLQSGEYAPVGSTRVRRCETRVIGATNQELESLVESGRFRDDLYYRLNIIQVEIPPLRKRPADVALLARYFIDRHAGAAGTVGMDGAALRMLTHYRFPGNVRELENIVQRALLLSQNETICAHHLPAHLRRAKRIHTRREDCANFHEAKARVVEDFERGFIVDALNRCGGIVSRAADTSGLSERNFHAKLKQYHIVSKSFRVGGGSQIAGAG